jgi:hypothetical protein
VLNLLGKVDHQTIDLINKQFDALDIDGGGTVLFPLKQPTPRSNQHSALDIDGGGTMRVFNHGFCRARVSSIRYGWRWHDAHL